MSTDKIPSFDPQETESITEIPPRFLVEGYLSLSKNGEWRFQGEPIEHPGVCLFLTKQLRRNQEGQYWVVNGPQRALVKLEETPFFVTQLSISHKAGTIAARLNDQTQEILREGALFRGPDEVLYARVKWGQAGAQEGQCHLARVLRTAVMALESVLLELDSGHIALSVGDHTILVEQHEDIWSQCK